MLAWHFFLLAGLISSVESSDCDHNDKVNPCTDRSNKTCFEKTRLCGGEILCQDKTDINWCKKSDRANEPCPRPGHYRRCNTTKGLPGQCIQYSKVQNKIYSCSDRSDENPFAIVSSPIDFSLLKNCTIGGNNGLFCDKSKNHCIRMSYWCQSDRAYLCSSLGNRYTNDPQLCRNKTFWDLEQNRCSQSRDQRCQGRNAGRCLETSEWGDNKLGCDNGLDMYQEIKPTDPNNSIANETGYERASWTLQKYHTEVKKESISADQCTTEGRVQCKVRGVDMCLDNRSRCDSHPQCDVRNPGDMPEDEKNCVVKALKEKMEEDLRNRPEMTHKCQSPFYDPAVVKVYTLATPCDAVVECWARKDELNCDSLMTRMVILGITVSLVIMVIFVAELFECLSLKKCETTSKAKEENRCSVKDTKVSLAREASTRMLPKVDNIETGEDQKANISKENIQIAAPQNEGPSIAVKESSFTGDERKQEINDNSKEPLTELTPKEEEAAPSLEEELQGSMEEGPVTNEATKNKDRLEDQLSIRMFRDEDESDNPQKDILESNESNSVEEAEIDAVKVLASDSDEDFKHVIKHPQISAILTQIQHIGLSPEDRRNRNKRFVIALQAEQSKERAFLTLKRKVTRNTAQELVDDFNRANSCWEKLKVKVRDKVESVKEMYDATSCACIGSMTCCGRCEKDGTCYMCHLGPSTKASKFGILKDITMNYYDLVKDLTLVASMWCALDYHLLDGELFNVITWILTCSIVIPLILSAAETAYLHPAVVMDRRRFFVYQKAPTRLLRVAVFLFYLVVPARVISNIEKAKKKRTKLLEEGKKTFQNSDGQNRATNEELLSELDNVECYLENLQKAKVVFYKNEASIEIPVQVTVQILMLLMANTKTPTFIGRNAFFEISDFFVFWLDRSNALKVIIGFSFFKIGRRYVKILKGKKSNFLPFFSALPLYLRAFLVSSVRVSCYVAFFGPFLGLLSCLQHLQAEQMDWDPELLEKLTGPNSYWDKNTTDVLFKKVKPDYTAYTLVDLETAALIFLAILVVYGAVLFIAKHALSARFRKAGWYNRAKYIIEGLNMPEALKDWDEDENECTTSTEHYRSGRNWVLIETIGMMAIHLFFNLVFIMPTILTGWAIQERHELIEPRIGSFKEEKEAYQLAQFIEILLLSSVLVSFFVDASLVILYQMVIHPSKFILQKD